MRRERKIRRRKKEVVGASSSHLYNHVSGHHEKLGALLPTSSWKAMFGC
jgi:hypothetical protein